MKGKEKSKMSIWTVGLGVVGVLGVAGAVGWSKLSKEHQEAKSLPLKAVDFRKLKDGAYHGAYAGGMYKWRANECDVTVANGKVTAIQLASSKDPGAKNAQCQVLYDRVINAQSLQVDTISGSTLTSKAYLKAVEDALDKAQ
jgi:uncharacterized protein with FMN-binding domain